MGTIRSSLSLSSVYLATESINNNDEELTTTVSAMTSTLSSTFPDVNIVINTANSYIDSLSTEQLAEFDRQLELKELEFMTVEEIDAGKDNQTIIQKQNNSSINSTNNKAKVYKKI